MTKSATICAGQFARPGLSKDGRTMTVHIPITLRHQGGRKQVVTPASATRWVPAAARVDNTIVKATRPCPPLARHTGVRTLCHHP